MEEPKKHRLRQFTDEIVKRPRRKKRVIVKRHAGTKRNVNKKIALEEIEITRFNERIRVLRIFESTLIDAITGFPVVFKYLKTVKIRTDLFRMMCILYHYIGLRPVEFKCLMDEYSTMQCEARLRKLISLGYAEKKRDGTRTGAPYVYELSLAGEEVIKEFNVYYKNETKKMYRGLKNKRVTRSKVLPKLIASRTDFFNSLFQKTL